MSNVIIIGGGASGLVAAIKAAKKNHVTILEGNDKCGKKILLTGNGKCNYWNSDISTEKYNTDDIENLKEILKNQNQEKVLTFLENIGIYPIIKKGYYYPHSEQATSIRNMLLKELDKRKVNIIYNCKVNTIIKEKKQFNVKTNKGNFTADEIILATGGCAFPKTGSDGSGYLLAQSLGHKINQVTPALVQLKSQGKYLKKWAGVRILANITLWIEEEKKEEEQGELQLTDYGISGICTFNISGLVSKALIEEKKVKVIINFLPDLKTSFLHWMTKRAEKLPSFTIQELLESVIPYKLLNVLLQNAHINPNTLWKNLTKEEKKSLERHITNFSLPIFGTNSFEMAQVSRGGISLKEINPQTMESKQVSGLYIAGELLDVDGKCGGFNLAFAFITGYLAGENLSC